MKTNKVTKITKLFGINVKVARIKKGYSQERLSELADLSRPTIGAIERGENPPTIETAAKVANALNIDLYKLFIFDED